MLKDNLKEELQLDRDFHTNLEHLLMSMVNTNERILECSTQHLAQFEISPTQFNALMSLFDYQNKNEGKFLNQKELGEKLLINKASAGALIDRLCKRKWVKLIPNPKDGRSKLVKLTDQGHQKFLEAFESYYTHLWPLQDGISNDELITCLRVFKKLRNNTEKLK